jgi:hypothetical protein
MYQFRRQGVGSPVQNVDWHYVQAYVRSILVVCLVDSAQISNYFTLFGLIYIDKSFKKFLLSCSGQEKLQFNFM